MTPPLSALRDVMHQRLPINTAPLATETFLGDYRRRASLSGDIADWFHENTKYTPGQMAKPRQTAAEFDRRHLRYIQSRDPPGYSGRAPISLPEPPDIQTTPLTDVLGSRRSVDAFSADPLPVEHLSYLLYHAAGITGTAKIDVAASPMALRAYPSAGALYPVELILVIQESPDIAPGAYAYSPPDHALRRVACDDIAAFADGFAVPEAQATAPVMCVLIASFWRSKAKYGPRGYRYILQEAGHLAQNICLVADSIDLGTLPLGGFYDDYLNDWLGLHNTDEGVIYVLAIGHAEEVIHDE